MKELGVIELYAGRRPDGSAVVERLQVMEQDDDSLVLARSPAFVQGLAKGDQIKLDTKDQSFEIVRRSGNLCVRVIVKEDIETLAADLTPVFEKMGAELELETERILVYSAHVSLGFANIEKVLDEYVGEETESAWFYGNVYDPKDGVTPLNWWQDILKPQ